MHSPEAISSLRFGGTGKSLRNRELSDRAGSSDGSDQQRPLAPAKVKLKKKGGKLKKEEILIPSELPARSESSQFRRDFLVPPNRRLEIASGLCMIEKVLMLSLVFGEVEN
uniref:Uncharacterized protein n=1 Tax=Fagus sylvatica TaxID=28930 RepID=A0A2N9INB3_FAGSY